MSKRTGRKQQSPEVRDLLNKLDTLLTVKKLQEALGAEGAASDALQQAELNLKTLGNYTRNQRTGAAETLLKPTAQQVLNSLRAVNHAYRLCRTAGNTSQ